MSELLSVIDTELKLLKMRMQGLLPALSVKPTKKLHWTGKATDLVELLYALDTCDCINDGEIGVEELADALSEIFGVEIENCYNVYMNMKRRKDDSRTYFLDELREKIEQANGGERSERRQVQETIIVFKCLNQASRNERKPDLLSLRNNNTQ